jgi:aminopeptidase YwaD
MTDKEGDRLLKFAGRKVTLESRATRIPSTGCNVIGRKGANPERRVVFFAHIDAKRGTPGAIDNATGVVILMLLADLLADYNGELGIEIVALNGEDYYAASGEILWVQSNQGRFEQIVLGINMDGVGYREGNTAYSLYDLPNGLAELVRDALSGVPNLVEGQPWYQSDHSLFIQNGRPAVAFTSDAFDMLWTEIAHTHKDRPEIIDQARLVDVALALKEVIYGLEAQVQTMDNN